MGVIQVQNKFPAFRFAGESSKDYNVYITDVNVFDSAARDVQSVEIPGRNGAYILDHGRYKNVAVEYDCAIGAQGSTGAEDFADAVAAVRSWLGSHVGYYRLENDLNPDEYRMAAFTGEIEVDTVGVQMGRFSVKFDCKPQRFLVDGDTAQTITSGGTIENPTAFNARPLLMVTGYGDLNIGDDTISITDTPIGVYTIANSQMITGRHVIQNVGALLNTGDMFKVSGGYLDFEIKGAEGYRVNLNTVSFSPSSADITAAIISTPTAWSFIARVSNTFADAFMKGTSHTNTVTTGFSCDYYPIGSPASTATASGTAGIKMTYDANADTLEIWRYAVYTGTTNVIGDTVAQNTGTITGDSSKGSLGEPLYLDLDIGEAYKYESGNVVSVNNAVSFGAELPELPPGETAITFDNTVTQLQVVPRWWRL